MIFLVEKIVFTIQKVEISIFRRFISLEKMEN